MIAFDMYEKGRKFYILREKERKAERKYYLIKLLDKYSNRQLLIEL